MTIQHKENIDWHYVLDNALLSNYQTTLRYKFHIAMPFHLFVTEKWLKKEINALLEDAVNQKLIAGFKYVSDTFIAYQIHSFESKLGQKQKKGGLRLLNNPWTLYLPEHLNYPRLIMLIHQIEQRLLCIPTLQYRCLSQADLALSNHISFRQENIEINGKLDYASIAYASEHILASLRQAGLASQIYLRLKEEYNNSLETMGDIFYSTEEHPHRSLFVNIATQRYTYIKTIFSPQDDAVDRILLATKIELLGALLYSQSKRFEAIETLFKVIKNENLNLRQLKPIVKEKLGELPDCRDFFFFKSKGSRLRRDLNKVFETWFSPEQTLSEAILTQWRFECRDEIKELALRSGFESC